MEQQWILNILGSFGPMSPSMFATLYAFIFVGVMEWGDGTMILANSLLLKERQKGPKGRPIKVVLGVMIGSIISPGFGVGVVALLKGHREFEFILHGISAIIFLVLGYQTLTKYFSNEDDEEEDGRWLRALKRVAASLGVMWGTTVLFTGLESIDRTEITTIGIGFQGIPWLANWIGSAAGLMVSNLISLGIVWRATAFQPQKRLALIGGLLFLVGAGYMGYKTYDTYPPGWMGWALSKFGALGLLEWTIVAVLGILSLVLVRRRMRPH